MDRLLARLTRPLWTTIKLVDEMIAASSIEAAATACAEIERRKALRRAIAELERPAHYRSGVDERVWDSAVAKRRSGVPPASVRA